jgi:hypothetical protein
MVELVEHQPSYMQVTEDCAHLSQLLRYRMARAVRGIPRIPQCCIQPMLGWDWRRLDHHHRGTPNLPCGMIVWRIAVGAMVADRALAIIGLTNEAEVGHPRRRRLV